MLYEVITIDPDHCRNVEIRNCHIRCGDDAIVVKTTRQSFDFGPSTNIWVHGCVIETQDSGVKIGTRITSYNVCYTKLLRDVPNTSAMDC